jgi:hypothetical protein
MRNPWTELPGRAPFVLADDLAYVEAFNRYARADVALDLDLLPHPVLGPREGSLVVLGLNPGVAADSLTSERGALAEACRASVVDPTDGGPAHPGLLGAYRGSALGRWWRRCLGGPMGEGRDPEAIAPRVLSVEFHGYHSRSWSAPPVTLPSQRFGFALVEAAIGRGATIVLLRGERAWMVAVPALGSYAGCVRNPHPRVSRISAGNLGEEGYGKVLAALG